MAEMYSKDKQNDRALLAVASADGATEFTHKNWTDRYADRVGMDYTADREFRGFPAGEISGGKPVFVQVDTTHPLLSTESDMGGGCRLNPKEFADALESRYGLEKGVDYRVVAFISAEKKDGTSPVKPQLIVMLGGDAKRNLAMQALKKLADPSIGSQLLQISLADYNNQMQSPESDFAQLVTSIVRNGQFTKRDPELTELKRRAGENSEFSHTVTAAERSLPEAEVGMKWAESVTPQTTGVPGRLIP